MKILEELWYGNISPIEQSTYGNKEINKLFEIALRNRDRLFELLTDEQKKALEKYEDQINEMHYTIEREIFKYTFRLCCKLMAESLQHDTDL